MIQSLLYASLILLLKQSINLAYFGNDTYDQINAHIE